MALRGGGNEVHSLAHFRKRRRFIAAWRDEIIGEDLPGALRASGLIAHHLLPRRSERREIG